MQNPTTGPRTRFRSMTSMLVAAILALPVCAAAQDRSGDPTAGGLSSGDYLLLSGGATIPVNAQGSLKNYKAGPVFGLAYENWQPGTGGVGAVAFGLAGSYSSLPTKAGFAEAVAAVSGGQAGTASAKPAKIFEVMSSLRIRIPSPLVMPAVTLGLGFINWAPGPITYATTGGGSAKVRYQHRSGAELSVGGSIDRHIYDRYGVFGEADYVYGFTSFGQAFTIPNGNCVATTCDPLKNTSVGMVRGGLRVALGR